MRNYQVAVILGLLVGIGLALGFEHMDNTFKTPEDVREHLPVPFLGMVPGRVGLKTAGAAPAGRASQVVKSPNSAVADAYRVLRTNLIFSSAETTGRVDPGDERRPRRGQDDDARQPGRGAGPERREGAGGRRRPAAADALPALRGAEDARAHGPDRGQGGGLGGDPVDAHRRGCSCCACGYLPPNPAELLGSPMMKQIVDALRAHYDWVLIDAPPLLAMADAPVLCPLVDGVVLVIAAEAATKPAVMRAIDQVQGVGGKVAGVVLNKVNLERNSYYYSQYYGEYYRSYYAESAAKRAAARRQRHASRRRPGRPARPARRV